MNNSTDLFFSFSLKNPSKSKCGDASFSGLIKNKDKEFILLIAADGVSKAPKDYLASTSVVKFIIEYLESEPINNIKNDFEKAVLFANSQICLGVEGTIGMLSTLSALLYCQANGKLYFINIGDSRIFGFKTNTWNQLTIDDASRILYKENGKLKLQNGVPIFMSGLTKAIGGNKNLSLEAIELNDNEYSGFALSTDGFYSLNNWENLLGELFHSISPKQWLEKNTNELLGTIHDDATVSFLRLPIPKAFQLTKENLSNVHYSNAMVLLFTNKELDKAFMLKDIPLINELVLRLIKYQILDSKPKMILLLEKLIQFQATESIQSLTDLIRKM